MVQLFEPLGRSAAGTTWHVPPPDQARRMRFKRCTLINTGHREVVDADLSGYFQSPRKELMQSVARRIWIGRC